MIFFANEKDDTVNEWCRMIINGLPRDVYVLFVTGRRLPDNNDHATYHWLTDNGFLDSPLARLMGRKEDDFRKDYVIKEELYKNYIQPKYDVIFAIDDRRQVVDMWRRIGITCLQCADHNF